MARFRHHKNSLIGGEISPTALGRVDLPAYQHACKTLRNMIPLLAGGAYRRPGTLWEEEVDAATYFAPALVPHYAETFDTRTTSNNSYCHILMNPLASGSSLNLRTLTPDRENYDASTVMDATASGPHGLVTGSDNIKLPPASYAELRSDVLYDRMLSYHRAQSGDVQYLAFEGMIPQRIARVSSAINGSGEYTTGTFEIRDHNVIPGSGISERETQPWLAQNTTSITLQPNAAAATTLTASAAFFNAGHVGAFFMIDHAGVTGVARVTSWVSTVLVNVTTLVNFNGTSAQLTWWESAWSPYRGYPRTVAFFQDRLVFGGTRFQPDTLWFSRKGNYNQMAKNLTVDPYNPSQATDAFTLDLTSRDLAAIQFLSPGKTLFIGTSQAEYSLGVGSDGTFSHESYNLNKESEYGSAYVQAARSGSEILCVDSSGEKIRAHTFNNDEQSFVAEELQTLFDDYPKNPLVNNSIGATTGRSVRQIAWDQSRSTLWCLDTAGDLFGLTRDRRAGVSAWHTHQIGGYDASVSGAGLQYDVGKYATDPVYTNPTGTVVSMAIVPNPSIGKDDLWLCVKRKRASGTWMYDVERMIGEGIRIDSAYNPVIGLGEYYTDATKNENILALPPPYIVTASLALEGLTPTIVGRNTKGIFVATGSVVSSGNSTLSPPYPGNVSGEITYYHSGLPFSSIVETVRIEAGSQVGSAQGAIKRIHQVVTRFFKTMYARIGRDASNLETINFRDANTPMVKSAELYTGDKLVKLDSDYDRDGHIYILCDKPLPFAVMSVTSEGQTYD